MQPSTSRDTEKRKLSALDDILLMEEKKREKQNRKDYWLHKVNKSIKFIHWIKTINFIKFKNIVVKIITKKLGEKYYQKKAVVTEVLDKYTGVVKIIETDAVIKLDQAHLETVLPSLGKKVMVLNGAYRGEVASLDGINVNDFNAKITILTVRFF